MSSTRAAILAPLVACTLLINAGLYYKHQLKATVYTTVTYSDNTTRVVTQYFTFPSNNETNRPWAASSPPLGPNVTSKARCNVTFACEKAKVHVINATEESFEVLNQLLGEGMLRGGMYEPKHCYEPSQLAIVIPFRNREPHLKVFLKNIIPFLKTQEVKFRIFVIEQGGPQLFNRAAMLNIGFLEALKRGPFDCFAFHDVDLVPENLCIRYRCGARPRHLTAAINKHNYRPQYSTNSGGAILLSVKMMKSFNGFTNICYGWGGEDDDTYSRAVMAGHKWLRYPNWIARYTMITHRRDDTNPKSHRKMTSIRRLWQYQKYDGVTTVKYTQVGVMEEPLFTKIKVLIDGPSTTQEMSPQYRKKMYQLQKMVVNDADEKERIHKLIELRKHKRTKKLRKRRPRKISPESNALPVAIPK